MGSLAVLLNHWTCRSTVTVTVTYKVPDLHFPFKRKVLPGSTLNGVLLLDAECYCYWSRLQNARFCEMQGYRGRGRSKASFRNTYAGLMKIVGVEISNGWLSDMVECSKDRDQWRSKVADFELKPIPKRTPRRSIRIANL